MRVNDDRMNWDERTTELVIIVAFGKCNPGWLNDKTAVVSNSRFSLFTHFNEKIEI